MKILLLVFFIVISFLCKAQIGVGTTTPHSTLDVRGSLSTSYRPFTTSISATTDDQTMVFIGAAAATLTLPDASTCVGRNYTIKNASTTSPVPVLTIATTSAQLLNTAATFTLDDSHEAITIVSNGTGWEIVVPGYAQKRNNFVLVKSEADLPAPVAGIITLIPTILYEINGTIMITNKINLNGSWIMGKDIVNDKLIYSGSTGELFTNGANGGNIRNLTMIASGTGTKVFNLDAGGANKNLIIQNCYFILNHNIGTIKGYGGNVYMQTNAFFYNTNGITFQDCNNVIIANSLWENSNKNIFEKYIGTFNVIQKVLGAMQTTVANTATAMDVTGITSISSGEIKQVFFMGTGTFVNGTFSKQWEVFTNGLSTETDDVAAGNLYLTSELNTDFSAATTPTKVLGSTISTGLFRVTSPTDNRLTYTGTKSRRFQVIASLSLTAVSANKYFSFYIAKNGIILPESRQGMKLGSGVDKGSGTLSCTVQMAANDYLEVWVQNDTDGTSVKIESLNLAIK